MSLEREFKEWLRRTILAPFCLVLIAANAALWLYLRSSGGSGLKSLLWLGASLAVSVAVVYLLQARAWASARDLFVGPFNEIVSAGRWTLRHLLGRSDAKSDVAEEYEETAAPVLEALEAWEQQNQVRVGTLTADEQTEMRKDLDLAMEFQQAYLNRPYPKVPAVHGPGRLRLVFYHRYKPALALGGDFFDILTYGPDCAGVLVTDVMGHGTRSALITAVIRTLIRDLSQQGRNASHFISGLNRSMIELLGVLPHPIFASAFYFVADTTGRVATYCSAGHPAPFHLRRSVGRVSRLKMEGEQGAALGLLANEVYPGGTCRLIAGDMFLFFTDGVYEAMNRRGEEFGLARVEQAIRGVLYRPARVVVDTIMTEVETFVGSEQLPDDLCLVAVEVTTEEASAL